MSVITATGLFAPTAAEKPKPDLVVKTIPLHGHVFAEDAQVLPAILVAASER